ncbi:MAG: hypothetical protein HYY22_09380 [Thaumarchaeota archaeon]|nr:hypothetical protein [Nitrososphaerota archaeon]
MMSNSKPKRNEILKTAALYAVLFIVTSMSTSALLVPLAAAHPEDCGDERTGSTFFYAKGLNTDTYYDIYGVKAKSLITNLSICGHFQTDASIGGDIVWVTGANLNMVETGFYRGNYTTYGLVSNDANHYFWGKRTSGGSLTYGDISSGTGYNPTTGDYIYFSTYGNANQYNNDWHVTIEKVGSYTINVNGLTVSANKGAQSSVLMEMHNSYSSGTARFQDIQNAQLQGGGLYWVPWLNGYAINDNPFYATEVSETEYCMYTSGGSCP